MKQFGVIADMMKEGLIRHAGLSQVRVEEIESARKVFPVSTVQNLYNLAYRKSEGVVEYCETHGIGFIPWFPLSAGKLTQAGTPLDDIVHRTGAAPSQVALAWILKRSPVILPIPGTANIGHLEDNVRAADLVLSDEDFDALNRAAVTA